MTVKQSYPLSILFITVAICAIMATLVSSLFPYLESRIWDYWWLPVACLACGLFGSLVGAVMGMHAHRRAARTFGGAATGALVGLAVGPLLFIDSRGITHVFWLQIAGGLVLLGITAIFRLFRGDRWWRTP